MSVLAEQPCRALWAAVVLQAVEDVRSTVIGSIEFDHAAAFLTATGAWAESRAAIADCLDCHPDQILRSGARYVAERRVAEGLPAVAAVPALVVLPPPSRPSASHAVTRRILSGWQQRGERNPFAPLAIKSTDNPP